MVSTNPNEESGLPPEAVEFLRQGGQLEYDPTGCEPGHVILRALNELKLGKAWIDPSELSNFSVWNPHSETDGYYEIPCVSLALEAEGHSPDGLIIWIPKLKLFGTCDTGHGIVWVFPSADWGTILENPASFVGAQWNVNPEIQALLVPWGLFPFVQANPYDDKEVFTA